MSECSTFVSSSPKYKAKLGAIGKSQNGRRVAILPISGCEEPVEMGELV